MTHGKDWTYRSGCRCDDCRAAHATRNAASNARRRRRDGTGMQDAAPVARRIRQLRAEGVSPRRVATVTGMSPSAIEQIASGKVRQVLPRTKDAIFGVTADDGAWVDGWKTRRLISEIERAGYGWDDLARILRRSARSVPGLLGNKRTRLTTFRRLLVVYRHLAAQGTVPASVLEEIT